MKSFDERADLAAERLVDYLKRYAMGRELGTDDPMYQLGMTMIERNRQEMCIRDRPLQTGHVADEGAPP